MIKNEFDACCRPFFFFNGVCVCVQGCVPLNLLMEEQF